MAPVLLLTRPRETSAKSTTQFEKLGYRIVVSPLIEFELLPARLPTLHDYEGLVFTSANGVRAFQHLHKTPAPVLPVFTVGARTAEAAHAYGLDDVTSADGDLAALQALLETKKPKGPLLYLAAENRSGELNPQSVEVVTWPLYRMAKTKSLTPEAEYGLQSGDIKAVALYSTRTAESFIALAAPLLTHRETPLAAFCLSQSIADTLAGHSGLKIYPAKTPTESALLDLARDHYGT